MVSRYCAAPARTMVRRSFVVKPRSRPAISRLAASRLTSHSQGPGRVSSKSLMPKTRLRSAVPNTPKFETCMSPQHWTVRPVTGVGARSPAITAALPRRNANGFASMRAYRIGTRWGTRVRACASRMSTGSCRLRGGSYSACALCGTLARSALPSAIRTSTGRTGVVKSGSSAPGDRSAVFACVFVFVFVDLATWNPRLVVHAVPGVTRRMNVVPYRVGDKGHLRPIGEML